jgi:ferredoxin
MSLKDIFIKPSTQEFIAEARKMPGFGLFELLHGLFYLRWPYFYIAMGTGRHPLARALAPLVGWLGRRITHDESQGQVNFADTYHGKAVPLETARKLVKIQQDIAIPDLEQVIPYQRARALILKHPDHIAVLQCPCRASRPNPCLPMDVCLIVGEPFAGFVMEHHPDKARWISPDEAVEILQAEDRRGHVHHVFFKDAVLGRFYAICNCCACCCGAMQAQRNGIPMLASSGYIAVNAPEDCIQCGACQSSCQFSAILLTEQGSQIDPQKCMGCGVCVGQCPQGIIHLQPEPSRGIPLEIEALMMQAMKQK